MAEDLYLMSPAEIVVSFVPGYVDAPPPVSSSPRLGPRQTLERIVLDALTTPPCGVAFSGGRDSSVVLAVATHVARRDGLPDPVPVTIGFPGAPGADEREWQEVVVRHLGIADWQRVTVHDELDLVGPLAVQQLVAHGGVVWPPTVVGDVPLLTTLGGGTLLTGEGGDEVLGDENHRIVPLARLARRPRPLRWRRVRAALGALAPDVVRGHHEAGRIDRETTSWLRPAGIELMRSFVDEYARQQPLSFAASVRKSLRLRAQLVAARNRTLLAARRGVALRSPLLHPDFVDAIARAGGVLGSGHRTRVLDELVPDLLPADVRGRTSKAAFDACYLNRHAREFAAVWSGDGLDTELVDPDELRRSWAAGTAPVSTGPLLQTAWLAEQAASARSATRSSRP